MCPATSTTDFLDGCATASAHLAVLAKYLEVVGEISVFTTSVFEVLKGGAAHSDGFLHDVTGGGA